MIAIKRVCIISSLLLTACAPKPSVINTPLNPQTLPSGATAELNAPTGSAAIIQNKGLAQAEIPTNIKDAKGAVKLVGNKSPTTSAASKISSWNLSGAMAAHSNNKGWSASVNWIQRGPSQYQIRLSGPLGSGAVLISRNGGTVTLRDGAKSVTSSSAESLFKQQTGISLPVADLYYWVRGIPAPGSIQAESRDPAGHLTQFRQAGYTVQYLQYTSANGLTLPSHIKLQGNGISIKLIIKSWSI